MNKPYVTMEEVKKNQGDNARGYKLLTEANGCVAGCCSGISFYSSTEFNNSILGLSSPFSAALICLWEIFSSIIL